MAFFAAGAGGSSRMVELVCQVRPGAPSRRCEHAVSARAALAVGLYPGVHACAHAHTRTNA